MILLHLGISQSILEPYDISERVCVCKHGSVDVRARANVSTCDENSS